MPYQVTGQWFVCPYCHEPSIALPLNTWETRYGLLVPSQTPWGDTALRKQCDCAYASLDALMPIDDWLIEWVDEGEAEIAARILRRLRPRYESAAEWLADLGREFEADGVDNFAPILDAMQENKMIEFEFAWLEESGACTGTRQIVINHLGRERNDDPYLSELMAMLEGVAP